MKSGRFDIDGDRLRRSMRLYAVTDRSWTGDLLTDIEAALKGGATCLQLREKDLSDTEFEAEALAVMALCERYQVLFIINDNVRLAARCGADGVHVGPVVAIGGINISNLKHLTGTGIDGVAIVSAIFAAGSPEQITQRCRELYALAGCLNHE